MAVKASIGGGGRVRDEDQRIKKERRLGNNAREKKTKKKGIEKEKGKPIHKS